MGDDEVCVDCDTAKVKSEKRAASVAGGLQLGECTPLYQAWADCIKQSRGQASQCADVLKSFQECHAGASRGS